MQKLLSFSNKKYKHIETNKRREMTRKELDELAYVPMLYSQFKCEQLMLICQFELCICILNISCHATNTKLHIVNVCTSCCCNICNLGRIKN